MDATTPPDAALELPADRLGEPRVGNPSREGFAYGDHQLDAIEPTLLEVSDELRPEGLGLAVAHLETQQFAPAVAIHPHRHHRGTRGEPD